MPDENVAVAFRRVACLDIVFVGSCNFDTQWLVAVRVGAAHSRASVLFVGCRVGLVVGDVGVSVLQGSQRHFHRRRHFRCLRKARVRSSRPRGED
jgi:hypothetical protein